MWLEVKGGPRDQAGCVSGTITFQYPRRYVDLLGNASIAYYTATWDPATNTVKDSITNGAMFILGAAEGDPLPPKIRIIEDLQFSDGTSRRQAFWARPLANETGLEWDYAVPEPGYQVYDGGTLQLSLTELDDRVQALETAMGGSGAHASIDACFTADGSVVYICSKALTLQSAATDGTGSVLYSKKPSGGAWGVAGALPASLAVGDCLKITASGVTGIYAVAVKGVYT